MKTHRLLVAITALLLTAVPSQSSADDVAVDIVSIAPRHPDAILAQIELNVLLKQYENVLTQLEEVLLERELDNEIVAADATEEWKKQVKERYEERQSERDHKLSALQKRAHNCRERIGVIMADANQRAAAFEKEQREAKKTTGQSQANRGTQTMSGKSGDGNGGTLTFTGETNIVPAPGKGAANDPQTGTLRLTPGQPGTQPGTLNINGEALKSGATLIFTADPNKAAIPPKAPADAPSPATK